MLYIWNMLSIRLKKHKTNKQTKKTHISTGCFWLPLKKKIDFCKKNSKRAKLKVKNQSSGSCLFSLVISPSSTLPVYNSIMWLLGSACRFLAAALCRECCAKNVWFTPTGCRTRAAGERGKSHHWTSSWNSREGRGRSRAGEDQWGCDWWKGKQTDNWAALKTTVQSAGAVESCGVMPQQTAALTDLLLNEASVDCTSRHSVLPDHGSAF